MLILFISEICLKHKNNNFFKLSVALILRELANKHPYYVQYNILCMTATSKIASDNNKNFMAILNLARPVCERPCQPAGS